MINQEKSEKIKFEVEGYECKRCGYHWIPKKDKYPVSCPKCRSAYWHTERINKKRKKKS